VYAIIAAVAQMQRGLHIEHTKSGLETARKRHKHLGGRKPKLDPCGDTSEDQRWHHFDPVPRGSAASQRDDVLPADVNPLH
jgi:hypothetical protein